MWEVHQSVTAGFNKQIYFQKAATLQSRYAQQTTKRRWKPTKAKTSQNGEAYSYSNNKTRATTLQYTKKNQLQKSITEL